MIVDITKGIEIGGFLYDVDISHAAHHALLAAGHAGSCDCRNQTIAIDVTESPAQVSETFIHEIIEAVDHVYCNDKLEHEKICQLSYGLHQVMESLGVRFGVTDG